MKAETCKRFDGCSAPLCPMDEGSLEFVSWYIDEPICGLQVFSHLSLIKNQHKISKKCHDLDGYFNLQMLSQNCIISKGIRGLDPDNEDSTTEEQTRRWLEKHPEKRKRSEAEIKILKNRILKYREGLVPLIKDQSAKENMNLDGLSSSKL